MPEPQSDEEIRACTVGELKPLSQRILIAGYDPQWPILFLRESERIRAILGGRAFQIEHAGSTSVPGLAAKPVIDIILVVADSSAEETYVHSLESAGYVLRIREPEWFEHRMFKGPDTDINLHVFSQGCAEIGRMLLFRDWLRANTDDRQLYERTKRSLAQREWKYVQNYADAKAAVVSQILSRAAHSTD